MKADGLALLLLAPTLLVAALALHELGAGSARRALLRRRAQTEPGEPRARVLARVLERRARSTGPGSRLELRLTASGVRITVLEFVGMCTVTAIAAYLLAQLLLSPVIAVLAAAGAVRGVLAWFDWKRGKRRDAFAAQLPDLARILSNTASAGLSINAGLEIAVEELEDPASPELRLALAEVRLGQALPSALDHMSERMPSRELGVLVSTLVIQQRSGGDLVRALADISETLDARKDLIREIRTLMSGQVATAWIVAVLGIGQVLLVNLIAPGTLHKMTSSPIGILILLVSVGLYAIGFTMILRITRVQT